MVREAAVAVIVYSLLASYAVDYIVISVINTNWKISAHDVGTSGSITALVLKFGWRVALLFRLVVSIAWARFARKVHTGAPVTKGMMPGMAFAAAEIDFLYKIAGAD